MPQNGFISCGTISLEATFALGKICLKLCLTSQKSDLTTKPSKMLTNNHLSICYSSHFFAEKYCRLVESEGGMALLEDLLSDQSPETRPYQRVIELASIVRDNVLNWRRLQLQHAEGGGGASSPAASNSSHQPPELEDQD